MFLNLTNIYDNWVIVPVDKIVRMDLCEIKSCGGLGIKILMTNGDEIVVQECLMDIKSMINIVEPTR